MHPCICSFKFSGNVDVPSLKTALGEVLDKGSGSHLWLPMTILGSIENNVQAQALPQPAWPGLSGRWGLGVLFLKSFPGGFNVYVA